MNAKEIKVFHFHPSCYTLGVQKFSSYEEVYKYIQSRSSDCRFFEIEYVKGTDIGKVARQMNQCFGSGYASLQRNKYLIRYMLNMCKKYGFKELYSQDK